jgi:hypothetical protein
MRAAPVDLDRLKQLRTQGLTWPVIAARLGFTGAHLKRVWARAEAARAHVTKR